MHHPNLAVSGVKMLKLKKKERGLSNCPSVYCLKISPPATWLMIVLSPNRESWQNRDFSFPKRMTGNPRAPNLIREKAFIYIFGDGGWVSLFMPKWMAVIGNRWWNTRAVQFGKIAPNRIYLKKGGGNQVNFILILWDLNVNHIFAFYVSTVKPR